MATKAAGKVAGTTAKLGFKMLRWLVISIVSLIGVPLFITILCAAILLLVLPGMILGGATGMDATELEQVRQDGGHIEAYEDTLDQDGFREWEAAAEEQLTLRANQLSQNDFWADLRTFFTTGKWGTAQATFKTAYANADDIDTDTGESISIGYFSSSNRMIAIIDEAFRASLRDDRKAMKNAKKMAKSKKTEYEDFAKENYPQPEDADDYRIDFNVEKDSELENEHFIYESCYLMAASSAKSTELDTYGTGVEDLLNYAFQITGLDDNSSEEEDETDTGAGTDAGSYTDDTICWLPAVNPSFETSTEDYVKETKYYDSDGNEVSSDSPDAVSSEDIMGVRYIVTITATYRVNLSPNYKDMVDDMCGIEEMPEDAESFDIAQKDWVHTSAIEIMKFYNASQGVELGEVGLPLPAGSYVISSGFGNRDLPGASGAHGGLDLAAPQDTPIYAVKDGVCQVSGQDSSYGNCVVITHEGGIKTRYAHMHYYVVSDGETVTAGQLIGYVGHTGNVVGSTGNHLHFEVIDASGQRTDPLLSDIGDLIQSNQRA